MQPIPYVKKFNYVALKQINDKEQGRHYTTLDGSSGKLKSVTTIIDQMKSAQKTKALNEWRNRVGRDNAATITKNAATVGTGMHKRVEDFLATGKLDDPTSNHVHVKSYNMAKVLIENGFKDLAEYWGSEVQLFYPQLYAGTTDLVGLYKGQEAILDYKQTLRPKKDSYVEDYKVQLAAYIAAHNHTHNTDIQIGVILMVAQDLTFQKWELTGEELVKYTDIWWGKVYDYYAAN